MKIKTLLFALAAALIVLPGCKKTSETTTTEPKTEDDPVKEVNVFVKNLNSLESCMGKSDAAVVAALQNEGFKSASVEEGKINALDTISGVVCSFSASCGSTSGKVYTIDCVFSTTETKSYVDDAAKFSEAIQEIGQTHNFPSGNALAFNDYAFDIKDQERNAGYDWNQMVAGLATLDQTYNAVFNWKYSGTNYSLLSLIRKVTDGTTSVTYKLIDYTYNN